MVRWARSHGIYLGVASVLAVQRVSALTTSFAVVPVLCSIALARSRSIRLDERRGEADLVEAMARLLLRRAKLLAADPWWRRCTPGARRAIGSG